MSGTPATAKFQQTAVMVATAGMPAKAKLQQTAGTPATAKFQ
jgi:hypothetical protein